MFHVEHFMKNILFLLFLSIFVVACHQPDPHPEHMDPIYADLEKERKEAESQYSAEEKQLEELAAALKDVKPQTGQIKYAKKRLYESQRRLEKLRQRKVYLELRTQSRQKWAQKDYLRAFNKNEPWPDPKEHEIYKSQMDLENAPKVWSSRDRIEKLSAPKKPAANEEGGGHH
jgi:septal ring factor EnvC (AmiA/AmiB activator)